MAQSVFSCSEERDVFEIGRVKRRKLVQVADLPPPQPNRTDIEKLELIIIQKVLNNENNEAIAKLICGYCAPPFEYVEIPEQATLIVSLISENLPRFRKGPYCTKFHIEVAQEERVVRVGAIETKLYSEHEIFGRCMWIAYMSVEIEYRNKGIGSMALSMLIKHYKNSGKFDCFALEAPHWDTGYKTNRVPFYERLNFISCGYVDGDKGDAMLMRLDL